MSISTTHVVTSHFYLADPLHVDLARCHLFLTTNTFPVTCPPSGKTRCLIDHMYQYSLDSFVTFFLKSITKAKPSDTVDGRVLNLRDALRMTIFTWVSRGLFERHKLIFLSQLAFNLMKRGILGEESIINELHFQFLLRGPRKQVNIVVARAFCKACVE